MKHCPTCNSDFVDDDLAFCTNDGTALVHVDASTSAASQVTQLFQAAPETIAITPPHTADVVAEQNRPPVSPQPYGWANEVTPAQVWTPPPPPRPNVNQQQTLAVISLVSGIAAITLGWICGGPLFALVAIVLGIVALTQIKRNPAQYGGKPLAIGGIITGTIVLLIYVVLVLIWGVIMFAGAASR